MDRELYSDATAAESSPFNNRSASEYSTVPQPSSLMNLPAEIRLQISEDIMKNCVFDVSSRSIWEIKYNEYHRGLSYCEPCRCSTFDGETFNEIIGPRERGLPGITKTCSQLYQETTPLLFKHCIFFFDYPQDFIDFCEYTYWSGALEVQRLKHFTALKDLTIHTEFQLDLETRFDSGGLNEGQILELAATDYRIRRFMGLRSLKLRSLTTVVSRLGSEFQYIQGDPSCRSLPQERFLRNIVLGPDKKQGTEPNAI